MASSGSFTTTSCEGRSLTFNWSVKSQNVANNQTTIQWSLIGSGDYTYGWVTCGNFKVTIDGKQVYFSATRINVYSGTVVASGTYTFTHDNSGNKSFTARAEAGIYYVAVTGIYYVAVNCSGSGSWSLPSISRAATITKAPNFNDEQNPTINYSNPAGNNVTSLQACISLTGSASDVAYRDISKTGTSYTFNLTETERNVLRQATTGKTRTVYFYIKTVINGTTLYNSYGVTFSITNANPVIGTLSYKDSKASTVAITGNNQKIIQNQSILQLIISSVSAQKYASISKVEYLINSYSVDITSSYTSPINIGTINYSSNFNLIVRVTDSRGYVSTKTITIQMLAWKLPYATIQMARRSNFYAETDILVNAQCSSVDNKNSVTIKYQYKKSNETSYSGLVTIANNTQVTATLDNAYDYDVRFIISDLFGSTTYNMILAKGIPLMFFDRNLNSVGVNCFPSKANDIALNGYSIIESGSNSNGNYVKFADGTMICYLNIEVTDQALNNAYGANLYQGSRTWTYPVQFIDDNVSVSCGQFQWGTSASWGTVINADKTSANLRGIDAFSRASGTATKIQATAIGRWK